MSADNYYLIRRLGTRFVVSCCFASDTYDTPTGERPIEPHDKVCDTLDAAREYAVGEYSEYGVREDVDGPPAPVAWTVEGNTHLWPNSAEDDAGLAAVTWFYRLRQHLRAGAVLLHADPYDPAKSREEQAKGGVTAFGVCPRTTFGTVTMHDGTVSARPLEGTADHRQHVYKAVPYAGCYGGADYRQHVHPGTPETWSYATPPDRAKLKAALTAAGVTPPRPFGTITMEPDKAFIDRSRASVAIGAEYPPAPNAPTATTPCPDCRGTGIVALLTSAKACGACKGSGRQS